MPRYGEIVLNAVFVPVFAIVIPVVADPVSPGCDVVSFAPVGMPEFKKDVLCPVC